MTVQSLREMAEKQLLGSLITGGWEYPYLPADVFEICPPSCFRLPVTRDVAEELRELSRDGKSSPDLVTLSRAVKESGKLGGKNIAMELALLVEASVFVSAPSLMAEAAKLADEARREDAAQELKKLERDVFTFAACPVDELGAKIAEVGRRLQEIPGVQAENFGDQLAEYQRDLDAGEDIKPIPTPWRELNQVLRGGVLPGELVVLAARPSVGKSAFALNWAYACACSGRQSVLHSLEMPRKQLLDRLMSNLGGVDVGSFRQGLDSQERIRVHQAVQKAKSSKLMLFDKAKTTVGEVRRSIRIAQQSGPVGMVLIDYLQLMTPEQRNASREREVAEISRDLKLMAVDLKVPVVLLAQLNRKSEEAKREPQLSDLRESGAIEQDADIVIFLHVSRRVWHPDEPIKVIVAKGRSSGVGAANLIFRRRIQRFEDSDAGAFRRAEEEDRQGPDMPELA